jgi:hypothetical protein
LSLPAAPVLIRTQLPPSRIQSPVSVPDPQLGESAHFVAARERVGRLENARRLTDAKAFYDNVREQFGDTHGTP